MDIEEIKLLLDDAMSGVVENLKRQLRKVRTGRASATVLEGVTVDYYGTATP